MNRLYAQTILRLRLHKIRSIWNWYEIGADENFRSALERFSYLVGNGFTYQSDPVGNPTVPEWYCTRVNPTVFRGTSTRVDSIQTELNSTDLV